jgi:Sigma-70, region 4
MTPQLIETANQAIDAELDRLAYSAYLLTLDPGLAMSVVMTAVEDAEQHIICSPPGLLRRTVELSLKQLRGEAAAMLDRESSAFEAVLYGDDTAAESKYPPSFKQNLSGNPIVLLDYAARVTFVLHHVLGFPIAEAAAMFEMSEKNYRTQLRKAYLRLASLQVRSGRSASSVVGEALA